MRNAVKGGKPGTMHREGSTPDTAHFVSTTDGTALVFNGDSWLNTGKLHFRASDPFTIGLWVKVPKELKKGVVFHQGSLHLTYGFRGFHLVVDGDRLQLEMVHTAPVNAITEFSAALFRGINGYTLALVMMDLPKLQAINYSWMEKN